MVMHIDSEIIYRYIENCNGEQHYEKSGRCPRFS